MSFFNKIIFVVFLFSVVGCDFRTVEQKNIDLVKESLFMEDIKVKDLAMELTGLDGKISWKSFISDSNQTIVEMIIHRKIKSKNKSIRIQWKVNPESGYVKTSYLEYDGKPTSLIVFALKTIEWA